MLTIAAVGGVSAAVSKTAAAPIERVKLLIQNQVRCAQWLQTARLFLLASGSAHLHRRCARRIQH